MASAYCVTITIYVYFLKQKGRQDHPVGDDQFCDKLLVSRVDKILVADTCSNKHFVLRRWCVTVFLFYLNCVLFDWQGCRIGCNDYLLVHAYQRATALSRSE